MDMDTLSSEVLLEGIPLSSHEHALPEELEFQKQLSSQRLFLDEFEHCDDVSTDWLDLLTSDPMLTDATDCDKICDAVIASTSSPLISVDDDDGALIATIDPSMLMNTEETGTIKTQIPRPEKVKIEPRTVKPVTSVAPMIVQSHASKPFAQQSLLKTRAAGNQRVVITGITSNHKSFSYTPRIKTEPHLIETTTDDVFVTTSSMPLTPPSSAGGSDSEGSSPPHSPIRHVLITKPYSHSYRTINPATAIYNQPIPTSGMLMLTEEEKRTFIAEGYPIPHKLPLSKIDERNMKKVRRKIKNKISAQESRRKKKEYMDQLEKQVDDIARENDSLRRKVENYESNNKSLISQLHKLQTLVKQYTCNSRITQQAGTCVMVLLLCFTIFLGNWCPISLFDSAEQSHSSLNTIDYTTTIRSSRTLLMTSEDTACAAEPWPISFAKHSLQTISKLIYSPTVHSELSPLYTNTVHTECTHHPNI